MILLWISFISHKQIKNKNNLLNIPQIFLKQKPTTLKPFEWLILK